MPRKKATNDAQSLALQQPTLAGFITTRSASKANQTANSISTTKAATTPKKTRPTRSTASTSKAPAKTTTAKPKTGPSTTKRRSRNKRNQTKSPKKEAPVRQEEPSDESGGDSDPGAFRAIRFESQEEMDTAESTIELTSSSEDEEEKITPRTRRTATQKMRASSGSERSGSDVEVIGGSAGAPRGTKRRLKRRLTSSDEEDHTETEGEEEVSPKRRRLVKGLKPSTSEEEINLQDEVDEHCIIDSRLRTRGKQTAFQRSLETLKRQRSGVSIDSPRSSEGEDEEDEPIPEPPRTEWDFFKPFAGARPSKQVEPGEENEEDDENEGNNEEEEGEEGENSWIVEDDNPEGVPELPTAFNMSSHQDLSHHFKIICQLFVHLAVRSPSRRASFIRDIKAAEDDYFYAALSTVRRKIMGMRDSLITSSVWQTKFKKVLEKYPVFSLADMAFAVPGCDACNLGGRMSRLIGRVSGQPYDRTTFEPIEESDTGEDSNSGQSEDEGEDEKPKKQMYLGRFCAKRTESFHEFTHWEWKLFELLSTEVRELRSTGETGFVKVAFARGIKPPENLEDGDGIMDWLDQRGIITMAWTDMKQMMERARKLESIGKRDED